MLKWRNKPIDELDEEELRLALGEAVHISLSDKNAIHNNDIVYSFATGIVLGTVVSIIGTLLAISL